MCGLVACVAYHPAAPAVDRDAVAAVAAALRQRGPDGEGAWHSGDGRVSLAHTRLAVIAPGEAGAQPMASRDGSVVISFNGEIYNHRALRGTLEAQGHRFRGDSDTEVLLAMYLQHGEDMLGRLRGMFAFAIWDGRSGELVLARDAYGIKPLYYADDGWTFRAASQARALLRDPAVGASPCAAGWAGFYLLGSVPDPFTVFQEVRALPAGSVMRVGAAGPAVPRRWFRLAAALRGAPAPSRAPGVGGEDAAPCRERSAEPERRDDVVPRRLRDSLLDSVREHLVADVPVGLFLSAGLDSGTLLALCREAGARPLAITLAFEGKAANVHDESALARECARHYGVDHHVERVAEAAFEEAMPQALAAMDQPSIDGINTWFVSRAARQHGLKVALSGIGADELLGGYPSFRDLPWLAPLSGIAARIPLLGGASRRLITPLVGRAGLHPKFAAVLSSGRGYAGAYLLRRGLFMPAELADLMGLEAAREGLARLQPLGLLENLLAPDPGTARGRVMALESGAYLCNQLLRDADWAGMAHGVEIRTPLVDRVLIQALGPHLARAARGGGKQMLAQVPARRLPRAILTRPKSGFHVPFEAWFARRPGGGGTRAPLAVAAVRAWAQTVAAAPWGR